MYDQYHYRPSSPLTVIAIRLLHLTVINYTYTMLDASRSRRRGPPTPKELSDPLL
jgi:hypothetical protein